MLIVRCKQCNKEISSTNKTQCCGCPNMMTVTGDNVSAVDLNKVIMLNSKKNTKQKSVLSSQDLMYQEERKNRKVRKLDFKVR